MLATDNYLEKYLNFSMQSLISRNIHSIVHKPDLTKQQRDKDGNLLPLTEEEKKSLKSYNDFKSFEEKTYKEFHSLVLTDDGFPNLKKTAFKMPGYRRVVKIEKEH
jgi:hypothetical protein